MEELEALEADMEGPPGPSQPPPPPAADYQHWRTSLASAAEDASRSRYAMFVAGSGLQSCDSII